MRHVFDRQSYLPRAGEATLQISHGYRAQYDGVSAILDANPEVIRMAHQDLRKLTPGARERKKGVYTSENIVRALTVHQMEQTTWRETAVRIGEMPFLQDFVRLGARPVMDFTFLNTCFKVIKPATWARINGVLRDYGVEQGHVDPSNIRVDTTVVEANIHYPTDASLVWDVWRVTTRVLGRVREQCKVLVPHRFHYRKVKRDYLYLSRYSASPSKKRQREVRRRQRRLLNQADRVIAIAQEVCRSPICRGDAAVNAFANELSGYLPSMRQVLSVAQRVWVQREKVPAVDRVFSIFEPHVELIKRGKAQTPVEFGHAVWLSQTADKFILDFETMEQKIPDEQLLEPILERHKEQLEAYPEGVAGDGGFRATVGVMQRIGQKVKTVAVAKRKWEEPAGLSWWQRFRAGIEGTISALKRAFRLSRCYYRTFKSFAAGVGMAIVCHNLIALANAGDP